MNGPWSQRWWSTSLNKRLTIWPSLVFWKHLSNTTWWPILNIVSASNIITKAFVFGYKLFKLVNRSRWGSKSKFGWTRRLEVSPSSCIRRLDIDGWEGWNRTSGKWAKENSQFSKFCEAMLSIIETKKKQSKLIMTWSNSWGKTTIFLYMFFKKLTFANIILMILLWWYLIKQK
jgi:hypothetical protein